MNCKSYQNLSVAEKIDFVGSVVHMVQNDEYAFHIAKTLINVGTVQGAFKNVKINPPTENALTHTA